MEEPSDRDARLSAAAALAEELCRRGVPCQRVDVDVSETTILSCWYNLPVWVTSSEYRWRVGPSFEAWETHGHDTDVTHVADRVETRYRELRRVPVD